MRSTGRFRLRRLLWLVPCLAATFLPCIAGVTVIFDSQTLNDLVGASATQEVLLPLAGSTTVKVLLEDLTVTGLLPSADATRAHAIRTSLKVSVPSLGIQVAVQPLIALAVTELNGESVLELRFEEVLVPLPLGRVDIARLLAPMRYPADAVFLLAGAQQDVRVRSRLTDLKMLPEEVRFEFDLVVLGAELP